MPRAQLHPGDPSSCTEERTSEVPGAIVGLKRGDGGAGNQAVGSPLGLAGMVKRSATILIPDTEEDVVAR